MKSNKIKEAIHQYAKSKISLGKAAEIAGLAISEMIELLAKLGIESNLELSDYIESQKLSEELL